MDELLRELDESKVTLQVVEGKLRWQAPTGAMSAALLSKIIERKPQLLQLLVDNFHVHVLRHRPANLFVMIGDCATLPDDLR